MKTTISAAFTLLMSFVLMTSAFAQDDITLDYYLPDDVTYDESIPTPEEIIGHQIGQWHITHDKLVYYMRALADASDRVTYMEYATTYEDRPLVMLTITSPDNH